MKIKCQELKYKLGTIPLQTFKVNVRTAIRTMLS